ncbi:hypothetical protein QJS10_CPB22g00287 [Acorus calamus]|uniref:Benenodin family lasso peptide n=1 Tax=Acorus calamus TaxID=4465 RepID=A0AAV9BZB7_ACOCL|nr:hypothetical protein QJS10_CPB22g00287 [Acorus calamus]
MSQDEFKDAGSEDVEEGIPSTIEGIRQGDGLRGLINTGNYGQVDSGGEPLDWDIQ